MISPTAIRHVPEDMTACVRAEVTLGELQRELGRRGQWLPVDPPATMTIRDVLDSNASGPRRYGYGTVREHLIGIRVRLPNGQEIRSGGQVVKNVAGYDLGKLFIGAQGRLGVITEATFKLRPRPAVERFVHADGRSWDEVAALLEAVAAAPVMPVVFDLISPGRVVLGFAGTAAEVEWQLAEVSRLGFTAPANLDYVHPLPRRASVLPSKLVETLRELRPAAFIARAGNGVIEYRGGEEWPVTSAPAELCARLEAAFR